MAFENAKIAMLPSSSGGGGIVTIYDVEETAVGNINTAYLNRDQATRPAALRTKTALADFIRAQQHVDGSNRSGVAGFAQGRSGKPVNLRITVADDADTFTVA